MGEKMDKKQVIQTTIGVLSEISVPVRLKEQIATQIEGAINNLVIVLQMIQMEEEAEAQRQEEAEKTEREIVEDGEKPEEAQPTGPIELKPEDVGCPEEEAAEDGHEADAE